MTPRGHWVARTPVEKIGTSVLVVEIRRGIELKWRSDAERAKYLDRRLSWLRTHLENRVLTINEPMADCPLMNL